MSDPAPFQGLSAFPLTPASDDGIVNTDALSSLLERICAAKVDSIGLLGSTGAYPYFDRKQRFRAIEAAVRCVNGRVPLIVGVGALRTDEAQQLARDAEAAGADALLMAPVSYTPLTQEEVYEHYRVVSGASGLPFCVYNNPSTTHFHFSIDLLERLANLPTIRGVKMPLPSTGDFRGEIALLRSRTSLSVGYSGDWGMADSLAAGADAFYSVLAGMMPNFVVPLAQAALAGNVEEAARIDTALRPMWDAFKTFGSLRAMYVLLDQHWPGKFSPPRPLLPLDASARHKVLAASEALIRIYPSPILGEPV